MNSTGRGAAALVLSVLVGLGGCAPDDGEEINPRPTSPSFTPSPTATPTPTPGADPNP